MAKRLSRDAANLLTTVTADVLDPSHAQPMVESNSSSAEEQALELHEVIELQTFSERKAWIEQKIEFLEKMPPIEVFVGLDAIRASSEHVPGLPTREELDQWIAEHDAIEKETEIFDRGELTKLRQLTKAATQRNLSPEDTDVIELTLTTIYALDKLLHLLRDRSENLDLLGIRLTWEENRISAWIEQRKLLEDLRNFIEIRARWSPSCYDNFVKHDDSIDPHRRASVTSLASNTSESSLTSQAISRSFRFKIAELLSRDAAHFAARVTSLRHGKIATAGKFLDQLIDHSRRPVPDVLLDEQDRLEEKGIGELEDIGKFVMGLVMQWRKADEIYIETTKDKSTAQNLYSEIEMARLHDPVQRQCTSFTSRAETLMKRIALRGNPSSPSSTFLSPEHPLFPDQHQCNIVLTRILSTEISAATELVRKVEEATKAYIVGYEALRRVEDLIASSTDLCSKFTQTLMHLLDGIASDDDDGSPVDLTTEVCLQPFRHSAFLALLPSVLRDTDQVVGQCDQILQDSISAMVELTNHPGIGPTFRDHAGSEFRRLSILRQQVIETCEDVKIRVDKLKEARKMWGSIVETAKRLEAVRHKVIRAIDLARWQQVSGRTEKVKHKNLFLEVPDQVLDELNRLETQFSQETTSMVSFFKVMDPSLKAWFTEAVAELDGFLKQTFKLAHLLQSVQRQTGVMLTVHEDFTQLHKHVADTIEKIKEQTDGVLMDGFKTRNLIEVKAQDSVTRVEEKIIDFINQLSRRIPFIGGYDEVIHSIQVVPDSALKLGFSLEMPNDLASLDHTVRNDTNWFVVHLNGEMERLAQAISQFHITNAGNEVECLLQGTITDIAVASQDLSGWKLQLSSIVSKGDELPTAFESFFNLVVSASREHGAKITASFQSIQDLLRKLEIIPGAHDMLVTRRSAVDFAKSRLNSWEVDVSVLKDDILYQQKMEEDRLARLSLEEDQRREEAKVRLAAEEAEWLKLEKERVAFEEDKKRLKEMQKMELLAQQVNMDRSAAEEAERLRLRFQLSESAGTHSLKGGYIVAQKLAELANAAGEADQVLLDEWIEEEGRLRKVDEQFNLKNTSSERQTTQASPNQQCRAEGGECALGSVLTSGFESFPKHISQDTDIVKDLFSLQVASAEKDSNAKEIHDLHTQIMSLRKRLRLLSINESSRSTRSTQTLPHPDQFRKTTQEFTRIVSEVSSLPISVNDVSVEVELRSLRSEVEASMEFMRRLENLVNFSEDVRACDAALSDLLDHIDNFPASPKAVKLSFSPPSDLPPPKKLSSRLSYVGHLIGNLATKSNGFRDDFRVIAETSRVVQTWRELEEMANEQFTAKKSSTSSTTNFYHDSITTVDTSGDCTRRSKRNGSYSSLSVSSTSQKRLLVPPQQPTRRIVSGSATEQSRTKHESRSASQFSSFSSNRSITGPVGLSLYHSTFASRQRRASLSNSTSTPVKHAPIAFPRHRTLTGQDKRVTSPTNSETSNYVRSHTRSSTSMSTWARAPRNSLSSLIPNITTTEATPHKKTPVPRKKYVANPKSRLDIAVGDVVNRLPVAINVEGVSETWKDKSGKYWIGNQDPKLCFCRILRSQTVMVRVGGGWSELSKFIQDHFAESFCLMPESPPHPGVKEEKLWISSASLLEQTESSPGHPPRTPEPIMPIPQSTIRTPTRRSPRSIKSSPSVKGSPLTPMQFTRRVDVDVLLRPATPTKPPRTRNATSHTHTLHRNSRNTVWRP